jgi:hypothetical protein
MLELGEAEDALAAESAAPAFELQAVSDRLAAATTRAIAEIFLRLISDFPGNRCRSHSPAERVLPLHKIFAAAPPVAP